MSDADRLARRLWEAAETVHALTYFAPESRHAYTDAGLTGFWRGYFAGRAAPMGPVQAGPVIATFYNFAPDFVRRALPEVWTRITPERAIEARASGAAAAITRVAAEVVAAEASPVGELVDLLRQFGAAAEPDAPGRPLFAANLELAWPDDPVAALWHGTTLLREHRGDGHLAALVGAGLGGCDAHLLRLAVSGQDREWLEPARGWDDDAQQAALARLAERDLVTTGGNPTPVGRDLLAEVEATTDRLAAGPLLALGDAATSRLLELLTPVANLVASTGTIPFPNPIGLGPQLDGS